MTPRHRIERAEEAGFTKDLARFVNAHHSYIDWRDRPARKMFWRLYEDDRLVGVFGLVSAWTMPRAVKAWMLENDLTFNAVANNSVYCLYGHEDRNAGSRFLALLRRDARIRWAERYGDDLRAVQTFILPPRNGAVYLADNWRKLGMTSGNSISTKTVTDDSDGQTSLSDGRSIVRSSAATEQKIMLARLL